MNYLGFPYKWHEKIKFTFCFIDQEAPENEFVYFFYN